MILQLDPPLPLDTPKGKGWAHLVIDCGLEADLLWVVFLDSNGECWTWPNPKVRLQQNVTLGRPNGKECHDGEQRPPDEWTGAHLHRVRPEDSCRTPQAAAGDVDLRKMFRD